MKNVKKYHLWSKKELENDNIEFTYKVNVKVFNRNAIYTNMFNH